MQVESAPGQEFKCDSCGKTYNRIENLRRHERTSHSSKPKFKCETCGKQCSRSDVLLAHKRKFHPTLDKTTVPANSSHPVPRSASNATKKSSNNTSSSSRRPNNLKDSDEDSDEDESSEGLRESPEQDAPRIYPAPRIPQPGSRIHSNSFTSNTDTSTSDSPGSSSSQQQQHHQHQNNPPAPSFANLSLSNGISGFDLLASASQAGVIPSSHQSTSSSAGSINWPQVQALLQGNRSPNLTVYQQSEFGKALQQLGSIVANSQNSPIITGGSGGGGAGLLAGGSGGGSGSQQKFTTFSSNAFINTNGFGQPILGVNGVNGNIQIDSLLATANANKSHNASSSSNAMNNNRTGSPAQDLGTMKIPSPSSLEGSDTSWLLETLESLANSNPGTPGGGFSTSSPESVGSSRVDASGNAASGSGSMNVDPADITASAWTFSQAVMQLAGGGGDNRTGGQAQYSMPIQNLGPISSEIINEIVDTHGASVSASDIVNSAFASTSQSNNDNGSGSGNGNGGGSGEQDVQNLTNYDWPGLEKALLTSEIYRNVQTLGLEEYMAMEIESKYMIPSSWVLPCYSIPHWQLPPIATLTRVAKRTFRRLVPHMPFVHEPTFSISTSPICLAFTICTTGGPKRRGPERARLDKIREGSLMPHGVVEEELLANESVGEDSWDGLKSVVKKNKIELLVKKTLHKIPQVDELYDRLSIVQGLMLFNAPALLGDHEPSKQEARYQLPTLITIARQSGLFDTEKAKAASVQRVFESLPGEEWFELADAMFESWKTWIKAEALRRTVFMLFLFDTSSSLDQNIPASLPATDIASLPLPASSLSWNAKDGQTWQLLQSTYDEVSLGEAVSACFSFNINGDAVATKKILPRMSGFAWTVVICAIAKEILVWKSAKSSLFYSSGSTQDDEEKKGRFQVALAQWYLGWLSRVDSSFQAPVNVDGPAYADEVYCEDAMPFFEAARNMLQNC